MAKGRGDDGSYIAASVIGSAKQSTNTMCATML